MIWNAGVLEFRAFGWGPVVVRRFLEGEQLVWPYADGSVTRLDRICRLHDRHGGMNGPWDLVRTEAAVAA